MPERDHGRRLLDAYRTTTVPDDDVEAAILGRLLQTRRVRRSAWRRVAMSAAASFLIAAAVLLLLRGAFVLASSLTRDDPPAQAPYGREPDPPTSPASATVEPAPPRVEANVVAPPTSPIPSMPKTPASAPDPARPRPLPPAPAPALQSPERSTLAEEASVLAAAQAALRDGDPNAALRSLAEHATRFPTGSMQEERESLRAIALCDSGRVEEGAALVRRQTAGGAPAPYANRMRAACSIE